MKDAIVVSMVCLSRKTHFPNFVTVQGNCLIRVIKLIRCVDLIDAYLTNTHHECPWCV